jgi:tetraacyldisaccharide 4'-kinase
MAGPWRPHPAWLPFTPLYWAGLRLHAAWMRARARRTAGPPLVIIGALRSGGSGKTSVTAALAIALTARGLKVGILAWRIGKGIGEGRGHAAAQPVSAGSDWRIYSDEAVLMARETGCPVFAVRDRAAAWRELSAEPFDLLLSDDGFQDRRLEGAFKILLAAPGEAPRFRDLLPAGPFRETAAARSRAQLILEGPWPEAADPNGGASPGGATLASEPLPFRRRFRIPPLPAGRAIVALATLGDPLPFLADLDRAGVRPAALVPGRNHREPPYAAMRSALARNPGALFLCTPKEAVRMDRNAPDGFAIAVARQEILLEASVVDRVLEACLHIRKRPVADPDSFRAP